MYLTYGNAKATNVVIFYQKDADRICKTFEVKTTRDKKFVTGFFQKYGDKTNYNHLDYWILVHIDKENNSHYHVLTHEEMGNV